MRKLIINLLIVLSIFLFSCSTTDRLTSKDSVIKRKYQKGYFVDLPFRKIKKLERNKIKIIENNETSDLVVKDENFLEQESQEILFASASDEVFQIVSNENNKPLIQKKEEVQKSKATQQDYIDVIYLKNGDIIKGTIIENAPNNYIKIEIAGGSVFTIKYEDILKMTREKVEHSYSDRKEYDSAKSETLSNFSFLSGILGLLFAGILFGPAAIILGFLGLSKISKNPEKWKGRGWAIAGIIIGFIGFIFGLVMLLVIL